MLGEKDVIKILESQFSSWINTVEKTKLSSKGKMELYKKIQSNLLDQVIRSSIEYGKALETKHNLKNIIQKEDNNELSFTDYEKQQIDKYVTFFTDNGLDAKVDFIFEPTKRDMLIIEEAIKRVKSSQKIK